MTDDPKSVEFNLVVEKSDLIGPPLLSRSFKEIGKCGSVVGPNIAQDDVVVRRLTGRFNRLVRPFNENVVCQTAIVGWVITGDGRIEHDDEAQSVLFHFVHQLGQISKVDGVDGEVTPSVHVINVGVLNVLRISILFD